MRWAIPALLCAPTGIAAFAAEEVHTIPTRRGLTLSYLLVTNQAAAPKIVVVSFVGEYGAITLAENKPPKFEPTATLIVRIRDRLADSDVAAAIVDSPSDEARGMTDRFRLGPEHLADIRALITDLKQRFPVRARAGRPSPTARGAKGIARPRWRVRRHLKACPVTHPLGSP